VGEVQYTTRHDANASSEAAWGTRPKNTSARANLESAGIITDGNLIGTRAIYVQKYDLNFTSDRSLREFTMPLEYELPCLLF
jgi:hypothetical protein